MKLTRRDAIAALAVGGTVAGGGAARLDPATDSAPSGNLGAHERDTLIAVAEVVYPSAVSGIASFVSTYVDGRAEREYVSGVVDVVRKLDDLGREWHGGRFVQLDLDTRERLLREVGADTADPDPSGSPGERVRYYLVNELLLALYASPTGGTLVGIENPPGHPGGLSSYQRGPDP